MPFIDLNIGGAGVIPGDATVTFTALCPSDLEVGDVVYVSGDKVGGLYQVDRVDITTTLKMPAAGLVIQKLTSTSALILSLGEVGGVYIDLVPGKSYFVGLDGRLTTDAPGPPTVGIRFVQPLAYSLSSDTLLVIKERPMIRVSG